MARPYDSDNGTDGRRFAPATERNRAPILSVLLDRLPKDGGVLLEIGSGSGEHAVHMAPELPGWSWQPSDRDDPCLKSIESWRRSTGTEGRVLPPLRLDLLQTPWLLQTAYQAIFAANVLHIAPEACTEALIQLAAQHLAPAGQLFLYGPFLVDGAHTAPSNAAFDQSLRGRDPSWGIRDRSMIAGIAAQHGLRLAAHVDMPANNQMLIVEKSDAAKATKS